MEAGFNQGCRDELTGGGLIRSLGGWSEVRKGALKGREYVKSNERILGDSDFVAAVLGQAEEKFERKYELKRLGYDLARVAARVGEIFELEEQDLFSNGKQQRKVKARSLLCYWAVREVAIFQIELAQRLKLGVPGIGSSVERGEYIARQNGYDLGNLLSNLRASRYIKKGDQASLA
jgi:hypothetical protein